MALTKIGSIGINTGIQFAGVTTIATLNGSDSVLSVGGTVNFVSDVSIGGTVSIAGTLTYEDVTNIDAVGLITARNGVIVGSGITLSKDGDAFFTGVTTSTTFSGNFSGGTISGTTGTFTGDVDIADKIVHTGDTNTAIRFSGADTVSIETAGSERVRVDSSGNLQVVRNVSIDNNGELAVFEDDTSLGYTNSAKLSLDYASNVARIRSSGNGSFTSRPLALFITNTEALRIDTSGKVGINETSPAAQLDVKGSGVPIVINSSNSNTYKIQLENAGSTLGYIGAVTDSIVFSNSSAAEQARFTDSGLKLPSGRGIDFSATSDASGMSSELLDDYEEGSFTPQFDGLSNTPAYAARNGRYTKIGRYVHITGIIQTGGTNPTFSDTSAILTLTGLPFAGTGVIYYVSLGNVSHQHWDCYGSGNNENNFASGDADFLYCQMVHNTSNMIFMMGKGSQTRARVRNNSMHNSGAIIIFELSVLLM